MRRTAVAVLVAFIAIASRASEVRLGSLSSLGDEARDECAGRYAFISFAYLAMNFFEPARSK